VSYNVNMSVYRDTNTSVTFEHPFPGPLVASVYRDGIKILESDPLMPVAGRYTLPLTYVETQYDGQLQVDWAGGTGEAPFLRTTSVDIITPLVPLSRLQTLFADTNWSPTELAELERSVRVFIESYTRQSYGYEISTKSVVGNGEKKIALPRRLIRATDIAGGPAGYFTVSNNGWYLYVGNKNLLTIKEAPPEDFMENLVWVTQGVIMVPDTYWKQFRNYSVPEDVQEAAMLLANDYACGDNLYRERYLDSIKSGDWNMVFNSGAFRGTGNVRADQLLSPYRREGMVII
jgi:hypothetical protein